MEKSLLSKITDKFRLIAILEGYAPNCGNCNYVPCGGGNEATIQYVAHFKLDSKIRNLSYLICEKWERR